MEALVVIFQESLVRSGYRGLENCKYYSAVPEGSEAKERNYTLVSLTSVDGKILEFIIKDEVSMYVQAQDKIG